MKIFLKSLLPIAFFFVSISAHAKIDPAQWQYVAEITGTGSKDGFVALELPPAFFSHLNADLSDLRVINGQGEVPYAAGIEQAESSNKELQTASTDQSKTIEELRATIKKNLEDIQNLKSNFQAYMESLVQNFDERKK